MGKKYKKLVYFDEQAAVDFLESSNNGQVTEKITEKVNKYKEVEGEAGIGKGLFDFFKVGLSGNYGRTNNTLIETEISRTVYTEFINQEEKGLVTFDKIKLSIVKDSLTYLRNITPYLKLFKSIEPLAQDKKLEELNHLEMDKILDNAKGYYEFIGVSESDPDKKYIIRFNINGMRNNYSLYDLVKMDLSMEGIKVGETTDANLEFEHEIEVMTQESEIKNDELGLDFNEEEAKKLNNTDIGRKEIIKIDIIDVIIAGV